MRYLALASLLFPIRPSKRIDAQFMAAWNQSRGKRAQQKPYIRIDRNVLWPYQLKYQRNSSTSRHLSIRFIIVSFSVTYCAWQHCAMFAVWFHRRFACSQNMLALFYLLGLRNEYRMTKNFFAFFKWCSRHGFFKQTQATFQTFIIPVVSNTNSNSSSIRQKWKQQKKARRHFFLSPFHLFCMRLKISFSFI